MTTSPYPTKKGYLAQCFLNSASVLLLTFALALILCNFVNSGLTPPHEPLLGCSLRVFFWILGALFAAGSVICLGGRSYFFRVALVTWLALNFEIYQLGLFFTGNHSLHAWFGVFSRIFDVPSRMLEIFALGAFLYLLVGGLLLAARFWIGDRKAQELAKQVASGEVLKYYCQGCGGRIAFSAANLGRKIPCPHCETTITLRKPEGLKMPCFFCKGHIEFQPHALGQKISCPHCKMDITLKEPA